MKNFTLHLILLLILSTQVLCQNTVQIDSQSQTLKVASGNTVQLECKVRNLQPQQQIVWFFVDHNQTIATGNTIRVTDYENKYTIFRPQDTGGYDYWNLQISFVQASDMGTYKCYVKGMESTVRVLHHLVITDAASIQDAPNINVTDCCVANGVEKCALPMCNTATSLTDLLKIATDSTCMNNNIIKVLSCGQDGRNHLGCCIRSGISDLCQDLCRGYTANLAADYTSCIGIPTISLVKCFKEGHLLLPSQPTGVSAVNMGTSVLVTWQQPVNNANLTVGYKIQYREKGADLFNTTGILMKNARSQTLYDLQLNTVYEIQVLAIATVGSSQPSQAVNIATGEVMSQKELTASIADCCVQHNVSKNCQGYCNASMLYMGGHPSSVLECYAEVDIMYICLSGHGNHTPCCQRVQVPDGCLGLCQGVPKNSWDIVQCLAYMPLISACMIEGSVALPDPPQRTHIVGGSVTSDSAIIQWEPPARPTNQQHYVVAWKNNRLKLQVWSSVEVFNGTQYKITGLEPASLYDVIVSTVNDKGSSLPELTLALVTEGVSSVTQKPYNETECCMQQGVSGDCLQLCVHKFRLTDQALLLGLKCQSAITPMLLCGTDGRDHQDCCKKRGVSADCLGLCNLQPGVTPTANFLPCAAYKDALTTCFDEGKAILPRAPTELSIKSIYVNSITLDWTAPSGPNVTQYLVEYSMDSRFWMKAPNTSETFLKIDHLTSDMIYYMRVTSMNNDGRSTPSNVVVAYTLPVPTQNKTENYWQQFWQNRSDCCMNSQIAAECQAACHRMEELDASKCAMDMDKIVACGADGRDHRKCCTRFPDFPEVCLPYCQGLPGSRDLTSALCLMYLGPIFTCFTEGQGLLPTPPTNVRAGAQSSTEIVMKWETPANNCDTSCTYETYIWEESTRKLLNKTSSLDLSYMFTGLSPGTTYRVSVASVNNLGLSLPAPYTIITTPPNSSTTVSVSQAPSGVVDSGTAVQLECVGLGGDLKSVIWVRNTQIVSKTNTYLMTSVSEKDSGIYMCNITFADGILKSKQLFLNVKYKPLVKKMVESTVLPGVDQDASLSCEFDGFPDFVNWLREEVLLSAGGRYMIPRAVTNLDTGKTVSTLTVRYVITEDFGSYTCNGSNKFGSMHSTGALRNIFPVTPPSESVPSNQTSISGCCRAKGIPEDCTQYICKYTIDVNAVLVNTQLTHCLAYLVDFFACGADGKDHTKCCTEQGITETCLPFCRGVIPDHDNPTELLACMPFANKLLNCAVDGQRYIPSPPKNVRVQVEYDTVKVFWDPPERNYDKLDVYYIHYKSNSIMETQDAASPQSRSKTLQAELIRLGEMYTVWVIAKNDFGSSNTSNYASINIQKLVPPAPTDIHADVIAAVNIDLKWQPPKTPVRVVKYAVHYTPNAGLERLIYPIGQQTNTRLVDLQPNTRYKISVAAYSSDGEGQMSNTIYVTTGVLSNGGSTSIQAQSSSDSVAVEAAVGSILGIVLLITVALLAFLIFRRMRSMQTSKPGTQTVAFENPQYAGEQRVTGLPEESESNNFGYGKLQEETDTEHGYVTLETSNTNTSARLNIDQQA